MPHITNDIAPVISLVKPQLLQYVQFSKTDLTILRKAEKILDAAVNLDKKLHGDENLKMAWCYLNSIIEEK